MISTIKYKQKSYKSIDWNTVRIESETLLFHNGIRFERKKKKERFENLYVVYSNGKKYNPLTNTFYCVSCRVKIRQITIPLEHPDDNKYARCRFFFLINTNPHGNNCGGNAPQQQVLPPPPPQGNDTNMNQRPPQMNQRPPRNTDNNVNRRNVGPSGQVSSNPAVYSGEYFRNEGNPSHQHLVGNFPQGFGRNSPNSPLHSSRQIMNQRNNGHSGSPVMNYANQQFNANRQSQAPNSPMNQRSPISRHHQQVDNNHGVPRSPQYHHSPTQMNRAMNAPIIHNNNNPEESSINAVIEPSGSMEGGDLVLVFFFLCEGHYNILLQIAPHLVVQGVVFGNEKAKFRPVTPVNKYFRDSLPKKYPKLKKYFENPLGRFVLECQSPSSEEAGQTLLSVVFNIQKKYGLEGTYTYINTKEKMIEDNSFERHLRTDDDDDDDDDDEDGFKDFDDMMGTGSTGGGDQFSDQNCPFHYGYDDLSLCNPEHQDMFGRNLLYYATAQNRFDVVKYLIEERDFDPNVRDVCGYSPSDVAETFKRDLIREYLQNKTKTTSSNEKEKEEEEGESEEKKKTITPMKVRCSKCPKKVTIEGTKVRHHCDGVSGKVKWENGEYDLKKIKIKHRCKGGKAHDMQREVMLGLEDDCKTCGKSPDSVGILSSREKRRGGRKTVDYSICFFDKK